MDDKLKEFIDTNTYKHNETGEYVKYAADLEVNGKPVGISLIVFDEIQLRVVSKEEFERDYTQVDVDVQNIL